MKTAVKLFLIVAAVFVLAAPFAAKAADHVCGTNEQGGSTATSNETQVCLNKDLDLKNLILAAINLIIDISGGVATLFIIIGGLRYVTAGDSQDATDQARRMLRAAIMGLAIIIVSIVLLNIAASAVCDAPVSRGVVIQCSTKI